MKTIHVFLTVVSTFLLVGCTQLPQVPGLKLGGGGENCGATISPSYFELIKNKTSNTYYGYAILSDRCNQYMEVPAEMNFTITDEGNVLFSKQLNVSKNDYVPYYSRISKKRIGGAIIFDVPSAVLFSSKDDYVEMVWDVDLVVNGVKKHYSEKRNVKVANIAEVE